MDIRQPIHSEHAKTLDTTGLRRHFLVEQLFVPEQATLTYSQIDRIIVGGIHPVNQTVRFAAELGKHTGTDFFLQRREPHRKDPRCTSANPSTVSTPARSTPQACAATSWSISFSWPSRPR